MVTNARIEDVRAALLRDALIKHPELSAVATVTGVVGVTNRIEIR